MINRFKNILKNKVNLTILLSVIIFFIVLIFNPFVHNLNKEFHDNYFKIQNKFIKKDISKDIVVVEIDERTLGELGRFPFDRKIYKKFLENIDQLQPKVVAFDIIFADKTNSESDNIFAKAIKKSGNIILGTFFDQKQLKKPLDILNENILGSGYYQYKKDNKKNKVYSLIPYQELKKGKDVEHFSIVILKSYLNKIKNKYLHSIKTDNKFYYINENTKIPLAREGSNEILINYVPTQKFKSISFIDIYNGNTDKIDLKDKIVIIGATAETLSDTMSTPINNEEFGVYLHANFINTVLTKNYIKYFNKNLEWAIIFLLIMLGVFININLSGVKLIFGNVAIVSIFIIIFPLTIIFSTNYILNFPFALLFSLLLSLMISNLVIYLFENKNKRKLNKALGEYVSTDVAKEILSGEGKINLDGEKKEISIFFSDIEGFTTISEKFTPEKLVVFLRDYLGIMSNIILDEKGFINKYEGDAIMALWGVFGKKEKDSYNACLSALKQMEELKVFNKKWKLKGYPEVKIRIGIHKGHAIIGNIGAEGRKMEFTALGDNVNLGSRLEGVNKYYGTYICVSHQVYIKNKDFFEFRYLDTIKVKGKDNSVKIYELLSEKSELDESKKKIIKDFDNAILLYKNKEFNKALSIFEKLYNAGDKPCGIYVKRCKEYIKNPPDNNWDTISIMTEK